MALLCLSFSLWGQKHWQDYANNTHIFATVSNGDTLWAATWGGLLEYRTSDWTLLHRYTQLDGLADQDIRCLDYLPESHELLMGSHSGGIARLRNGELLINLSTELGLASAQVNAICHKDSLVYAATPGGLSTFVSKKGFIFPLLLNNYNASNRLPSDNVTSLALYNDNLYVGTDAGIVWVPVDSLETAAAWHTLTVPNKYKKITSLAIGEQGIFAGTTYGLLWYNNSSTPTIFNSIAGVSDNPIYKLTLYQDVLYIVTGLWSETYLRLEKQTTEAFIRMYSDGSFDQRFIDGAPVVTAVDFCQEIPIVSTWGEGFYTYDTPLEQIKTNDIGATAIIAMMVDDKHRLWTASGHDGDGITARGTNGVSVLDDGNWTTYNTQNSAITTDNIVSLFQTNIGTGVAHSQGQIWAGSWSTNLSGWTSGINVFDPDYHTWSFFDDSAFGRDNIFFDFQKDPLGRIWTVDYVGALRILNSDGTLNASVTIPNLVVDPPWPDVLKIAFTDDKVFFGTYFHGVFIMNMSPSTIDINAWVQNTNSWSRATPTDLCSGRIYGFANYTTAWGENQLWIASDAGTFMYNGSNWYLYDVYIKRKVWQSGWVNNVLYYADEERIYGSNVTYPQAILVDALGRLWLGTSNWGLSMYDLNKERFTNYTKASYPLLSNSITALAYDPLGGLLYIGTPIGVNSVVVGGTQRPANTKFSGLVAFPSPFRPDRDKVITICNRNDDEVFPDGDNECRIFDLSGNLVITLDENSYFQFEWDGNNQKGKKCASGVYFYVVKAGDTTKRGKFALVR